MSPYTSGSCGVRRSNNITRWDGGSALTIERSTWSGLSRIQLSVISFSRVVTRVYRVAYLDDPTANRNRASFIQRNLAVRETRCITRLYRRCALLDKRRMTLGPTLALMSQPSYSPKSISAELYRCFLGRGRESHGEGPSH
jgi:hypothetical protein